MKFSTRDIQARLHALGFDPGAIDGIYGKRTDEAVKEAEAKRPGKSLFHSSGLHRVHLHWTAGAYGDIAMERKAYHVLILHDGRVVMGDYAPEANADTSDGHYAAHTRAANSGAIGVSLDAMGGAQERPFNAGPYPITETQLKRAALEIANLCETYDIPVTKYSVLTHAEVQPTLGVKQRFKWDVTWIPGMTSPGDPVEVGNVIRQMIRAYL
jgi:hypothetical protein